MSTAATPAPTNRKLAVGDLYSLEQYARQRAEFRPQVIAHKKARTIHCGPAMTWIFEDRLTVQYQVQEMLRIERIFEPEGIEDELDAYNPLIPDGSELESDAVDRVPGPGAAQARARTPEGSRGRLLDAGGRPRARGRNR